MKLNKDKCQSINSWHSYGEVRTDIGEEKIWETWDVELLKLVTDDQLKFERHVRGVYKELCQKSKMELRTLSKI